MKPRPKKRRSSKKKKRAKKNAVKHDFHMAIGGKIVSYTEGDDDIIISGNSEYFKKWAAYIFGFGILFTIALFSASSGTNWNIVTISMLLTPLLLFSLIALGYFIKSRKNGIVLINTKHHLILINSKEIPLSTISEMFVTRLPSASPKSNSYSYQLNLKFHSGYEILLFTDDSEANIQEVALFLCLKTAIVFSNEMRKA